VCTGDEGGGKGDGRALHYRGTSAPHAVRERGRQRETERGREGGREGASGRESESERERQRARAGERERGTHRQNTSQIVHTHPAIHAHTARHTPPASFPISRSTTPLILPQPQITRRASAMPARLRPARSGKRIIMTPIRKISLPANSTREDGPTAPRPFSSRATDSTHLGRCHALAGPRPALPAAAHQPP
jgi:hypothetical protein